MVLNPRNQVASALRILPSWWKDTGFWGPISWVIKQWQFFIISNNIAYISDILTKKNKGNDVAVHVFFPQRVKMPSSFSHYNSSEFI